MNNHYKILSEEYSLWYDTLGYNAKTRKRYTGIINQFFKWLQAKNTNHISQLNHNHIKNYFEYVQAVRSRKTQETYSIVHLNDIFFAVDKLCQFLVEMGMNTAPAPLNFRIKIVRYLFQNAKPVMKETEQLAFTQESMIEITKAYHDQVCTTGEPCIIFKSTPDKHFTLFRFSVFGGIQFNQLHDAAFNYKISPLIGGRMNISVPRFNKYLSVQLDLSVFKVSGQSVTAGPSYYDSNYLYTELNYLCVPIQIACKYTYGKYRLRPSIALGQTILLNFDYKEVQHYREGYNYVETDSQFIPDKQIYAAVGLDYVLKNGQAIFINAETRPLFGMRNISIKLGYSF